MIWMPTEEDVEAIHSQLTEIFLNEEDPISPPGMKSINLLSSACARPHTGAGDKYKYKTLEEKLAALFHSLTKNHAFHNGNKRTSLVTALTVLDRNGKRLGPSVTDDEVYDFVVSVTADNYPYNNHSMKMDDTIRHISQWFKRNSVPLTSRPSGMKTQEFLEKCELAGASIKQSKGGSYVISNKNKSIRFSQSVRQLDGMAIQKYLNKLSLNGNTSGILFEEFQDGYSRERAEIYRYMTALKRLAKT